MGGARLISESVHPRGLWRLGGVDTNGPYLVPVC